MSPSLGPLGFSEAVDASVVFSGDPVVGFTPEGKVEYCTSGDRVACLPPTVALDTTLKQVNLLCRGHCSGCPGVLSLGKCPLSSRAPQGIPHPKASWASAPHTSWQIQGCQGRSGLWLCHREPGFQSTQCYAPWNPDSSWPLCSGSQVTSLQTQSFSLGRCHNWVHM